MSVTAILELLQITETQSEKMTALNTLVSQLEQVIAGSYTLTTTSGTNVYDLPYDNSGDLSDRTALRFIRMLIDGGASANFQINHPGNKHAFFVRNDTDFFATFSAGGTTVLVSPRSGQVLYCDGLNFHRILEDSRKSSADFHIQYWGLPGPDELIADILVARDTTIPGGLLGTKVIADVSAQMNSGLIFEVYDNTQKFGEISISATGGFSAGSLSTTSPDGRIISAGDRLRIIGPTVVHPEFQNIRIAIPATVIL